jgi:gas vesicle protein
MTCFKQKVSWFLVGVGVGTVVSLLFAPMAGEDLLEQIASSAQEGAKNVRKRTRQAADTLDDFADRGRQQVNELVDQGEVASR